MTNHSFLTDCIPFFQTKLNRIPSRREKQDIYEISSKKELLESNPLLSPYFSYSRE